MNKEQLEQTIKDLENRIDKLEGLNKPFQVGDRVYSTFFKEYGTIKTTNFTNCSNKALVTLDGNHPKEADFVCSHESLIKEKDVIKEQPKSKFNVGDFVYSDFQEQFGCVEDIKYVTITNRVCYFSYLIRFGKKNDVWVSERNLHAGIVKKPHEPKFKIGDYVYSIFQNSSGYIYSIQSEICELNIYFKYFIKFEHSPGIVAYVWVSEEALVINSSNAKTPTLKEFKTGKEVVTEYKDADGSIWRHYEPLGEPK